jgi:hypothetical protein
MLAAQSCGPALLGRYSEKERQMPARPIKPTKPARLRADQIALPYQLIRNVTSPDEKTSNVETYVCNLQAAEILKLGTKGNLRTYLAEYNPRKRNRVHEAIRETIETSPQRFIVRNSGFVVTASGISVDDDRKVVILTDANIINGAQSQGEIKRYIEELTDQGEDAGELFFIRATIIVEPDSAEVMETAIARNIVTPVKSLSEAGARNQLDDLEKSIQEVFPEAKIRKSESQTGDEYLDTRQIIQLARLLMPTEVSGNSSASEKLRAYKNPEQCLTSFASWYDERHSDPSAKRKYDFTVQIAPRAIAEYRKWEKHPDWNGQRIWAETKKGGRAVRRDKRTNEIKWVSPGLIFPLMGALSEFAVRDKKGRWTINQPARFREKELIARAVNQFRAHNSDPMLMGRAEAAYDALRIYPQTLMEVLSDIKNS